MAIIRKSLKEILSEKSQLDHEALAATTEEDIRRHMIEDGEDPDEPLAKFELVNHDLFRQEEWLAGVRSGLEDADRSNFATEKEISAVLNRHNDSNAE